jgi:endonuclease/exonuclease/phosphatase family metal-dependent hydrolase
MRAVSTITLTRRLAAAALAIGLWTTPPASAETATHLTITTYNIIAIPCLAKDDLAVGIAKLVLDVKTCSPNPTWYGRTIAQRMKELERFLRAQASRDNGSDLVILQEAYTSEADQFNDGPMQAVIRSGVYPHVATGASSVLGNDIKSLIELGRNNSVKDPPRGAFSSGLVVFSQLPILETRTISFGRDCALDDCGSNKGVLFVRLRLPDGNTAAVYVTHMQANEKEEVIRRKQVKTFGTLVDQTAGASPYRFHVGDFNFRDTPESPSFRAFQRMTGATHAGQACLEESRCKLLPDDGKTVAKARGRGVDHHFFSTHAPGFAIEPSRVRYDDVLVEGRALSDHQYLKVRYRLVAP